MMRRAAITILSVMMGASLAADAFSQPACPALMADSVSADVLQRLARGVNLAGWMDSLDSTAPKDSILETLRRLQITHIRLPVPAERVMTRFSPAKDVSAHLGLVSRTLAKLNALGFAVSVDLHPGDDFNALHRDDPRAAIDAVKEAWRRLADVIRPFPAGQVYAELLNEPDVEARLWQSEVGELARFVRQLLPQTPLIVGPVNWQRADSLPQFRPLDDLNVVYAIHVYDPMVFTHQGHWDANDPMNSVRGLPYPVRAAAPEVRQIRRHLEMSSPSALRDLNAAIAETEKGDLLERSLEPAVTWQLQYRRPVIINEFGVLKAAAPPDSRARWLRAVVDQAQTHCWGWAHWELSQGFGLTDDTTGELDPRMIDALLGRREPRSVAPAPR